MLVLNRTGHRGPLGFVPAYDDDSDTSPKVVCVCVCMSLFVRVSPNILQMMVNVLCGANVTTTLSPPVHMQEIELEGVQSRSEGVQPICSLATSHIDTLTNVCLGEDWESKVLLFRIEKRACLLLGAFHA